MVDAKRLERGEYTLPSLLADRAAELGDRAALREKHHGVWREVSWAGYYHTARLVAHGLRRLGVQAGDAIIIASENTPEWFYADVGAQMIGARVIGIYPTNPWPELQYIARHCKARVAICGDQEQTDKVLDARGNGDGLPGLEYLFCVDMKGMERYAESEPLSFEHLLDLGRKQREEDPSVDLSLDELIGSGKPDDVNILIYTSGTTGPPKGAMLTHRNFIYATYAYAEATGMVGKPFDAVCYLPLCHAAERCYAFTQHLVLGGLISFAESIDTVAADVREIAPGFFLGVPRIWEKLQQGFEFRMKDSGSIQRAFYSWAMKKGRRLSDRRGANGGSLGIADQVLSRFLYLSMFRNMQRYMGLNRTHTRLCGGASVSPETLRFFDIIGLPVGQGYGLTESAGLASAQLSTRPMVIGSCGPALRGTEWRLADDGEILLRSPGVFAGYLNDEKGSREVLLPDGWLATGDIGEARGDEIAIVDRKKAIIITSGGKNIAPSEIENALKDSPFVREAIVVGEGRKFLGGLIQIDFDNVGRWAGERDLPYTTYRSLTLLTEVRNLVQEIIDEVNGRFARVENIRKFVILEKELDHDDGELTATQKVRRGLINQKFARELQQIYGDG